VRALRAGLPKQAIDPVEIVFVGELDDDLSGPRPFVHLNTGVEPVREAILDLQRPGRALSATSGAPTAFSAS
jgi:hypothetical protein